MTQLSNQPQQLACPADLTDAQKAAIGKDVTSPAVLVGSTKTFPAEVGTAPTLKPQSAGSGGGAGTTWLSNVHIISVWSINHDRSSWVYVDRVGWVKLSNASNSGIVALTMLAAYAKLSQKVVTCRRESDGMIHEIYA